MDAANNRSSQDRFDLSLNYRALEESTTSVSEVNRNPEQSDQINKAFGVDENAQAIIEVLQQQLDEEYAASLSLKEKVQNLEQEINIREKDALLEEETYRLMQQKISELELHVADLFIQMRQMLIREVDQRLNTNKLSGRVMDLSRRNAKLEKLVKNLPEGMINRQMIADADAFSEKCFIETVSFDSRGLPIPPNSLLNSGTTWDDLATQEAEYSPFCIMDNGMANFDLEVFNRKTDLFKAKQNKDFCPVPTGKFVGKEALTLGLYLLNRGENRIDVQFPLTVTRRIGEESLIEVFVARSLSSEEVQEISFLESGPLLNSKGDQARLSTSESVVQLELECLKYKINLENSEDRSFNLVDHKNNTDDAFITLGAEFFIVSSENIDLLQSKNGMTENFIEQIEINELIKNVQLGQFRVNHKQVLAFDHFVKNIGLIIEGCHNLLVEEIRRDISLNERSLPERLYDSEDILFGPSRQEVVEVIVPSRPREDSSRDSSNAFFSGKS
jgi:hypothetical protein